MTEYLLTIAGISFVIVLHELGHYLVARACRMRVLRFSLGFGPRLWERRFGETRWQVAALPIGGFVQIQGMGPADPDGPPEDARSFRNRPRWQRSASDRAVPIERCRSARHKSGQSCED